MVATDKQGRLVAVFAGAPTDASWQQDSLPAIHAALDTAAQDLRFGGCECLPDPPGGSKVNRRGEFKTAAIGVSFGGGQQVSIRDLTSRTILTLHLQEPGNLSHTPHNAKVLNTFLSNRHVRRALKFGSSTSWAHLCDLSWHSSRNRFICILRPLDVQILRQNPSPALPTESSSSSTLQGHYLPCRLAQFWTPGHLLPPQRPR